MESFHLFFLLLLVAFENKKNTQEFSSLRVLLTNSGGDVVGILKLFFHSDGGTCGSCCVLIGIVCSWLVGSIVVCPHQPLQKYQIDFTFKTKSMF